jgi:hypothetical protein
MSVSDLDLAKIALADREGMTSDPKTKYIGYWSPNEESEGVGVGLIAKWAGHVGVEAVVWTDLPPKDFPEKYHPDSADKVIAHSCVQNLLQFGSWWRWRALVGNAQRCPQGRWLGLGSHPQGLLLMLA